MRVNRNDLVGGCRGDGEEEFPKLGGEDVGGRRDDDLTDRGVRREV